MRHRSQRVIVNSGKSFDDADYDRLLDEFARDHPAPMKTWRCMERDCFERRQDLSAYPDQHFMRFCQDYLRPRLIDQMGGLGAFHVWSNLRGRVLRSLLQDEPSLHPAPGMVLITRPRTYSDQELIEIVEDFGRRQPDLWQHWVRVETAFDQFGQEPLRQVLSAFRQFIRERCWASSDGAISFAIGSVRGLCFSRLAKPH